MGYADDISAVLRTTDTDVNAYVQGAVDKAVATQKSADQQVIDSQNATITDLKAQIAALQNGGGVTTSMLIGGTLRNTRTGDSATLPRPVWDIVRTYNIGDALKALSAGKGKRVATSFGSMLNGPGWGKNSTTVTTLKNQLASIPDTPGHRVGDTHEFDNPDKYGTNVTAYLDDAAVFAQTVKQVNSTRKNPLIIFRCCMAFSITQAARNIDAFFTQDKGNYDEYGPDVYSYKQIDLVVQKAQQYGKPLVIPEFGPLNNVEHVDTLAQSTTNTAILDEMQRGIAAWTPIGTKWACWFDVKGAGADLDQYPKSLAYWTAQNAK